MTDLIGRVVTDDVEVEFEPDVGHDADISVLVSCHRQVSTRVFTACGLATHLEIFARVASLG